MELYTRAASAMSRVMTDHYSSSFGSATKMFESHMRPHIYNIYGLVRLADEIVDSYLGDDMLTLLDDLESETYTALTRGYSTNPVVHAFQVTAAQFSIGQELIRPFFESMRMDVRTQTYDQASYERYIYGSAEVVGLMCLLVFCDGKQVEYQKLKAGASRLGAAYQKVNFLRDMAADYKELGRIYFPNLTFETITENDKLAVIKDIRLDFEAARPALNRLPKQAKLAVAISYAYYSTLLNKLEATPISVIKQRRVRISKPRKLYLYLGTLLKGKA